VRVRVRVEVKEGSKSKAKQSKANKKGGPAKWADSELQAGRP
jgi:hypothetical protein